MKIKCLGLWMILPLLAIGCKSQTVQKETNSTAITMQTEENKITGEWELVDIKFRNMTDETMEDLFPLKTPYLVIDTVKMMIYGNNGCNVYRGPIKSLADNKILLDKGLASTLKYCSGVKPKVYMQALGEAKEYAVEKNELILRSEDQEVYLKFKKIQN